MSNMSKRDAGTGAIRAKHAWLGGTGILPVLPWV